MKKKNGVLLVAPATRLCSTLLSFMREMEAISFPYVSLAAHILATVQLFIE